MASLLGAQELCEDEVPAQPEVAGTVAQELGLQVVRGFGDIASHAGTVGDATAEGGATAEDAPHVPDVGGRVVEELQVSKSDGGK